MTELQGRGYLIAHTASYIRETVGKDDWRRIHSELSPRLRELVDGQVKNADWYGISLVNELNRHIVDTIGKRDNDRAREALYQCGRFIAGEATNTFLKIMLKMLTPGLLVRKLPDIFKRDFSSARMESELNGRTLTCRIYDVPGFEHGGATSPGFVAVAFEAMGKTVEKVTVHDWSLERPNVDGTWFELTWTD